MWAIVVTVLRVLLAVPLFAYIYFSIAGTSAAVQADQARTQMLRESGAVISAAADVLDPDNEGRVVHIQGLLSGPQMLDGETGADLAAVRVRREVQRRVKRVYNTGSAFRTGRTKVSYDWQTVTAEEVPSIANMKAMEQPEIITLGAFSLPVTDLPSLNPTRLDDHIYRLNGPNRYVRINRKSVADDRVVVRYRGIRYGTEFTAIGVQLGSDLAPLPSEILGQRPSLIVATGHKSVAQMADVFAEHYARQPSDWNWLYLLVSWLVIALLLGLIVKLPGIASTAAALSYTTAKWTGKILIQVFVAGSFLLLVYGVDRL